MSTSTAVTLRPRIATSIRRSGSSTGSCEIQAEVTGIDAVRDWFVDANNLFDRWTVVEPTYHFLDLGDVGCVGTVRAVGKEAGLRWKCPLRS